MEDDLSTFHHEGDPLDRAQNGQTVIKINPPGHAMPSITTIGVQALYKPEIKVEIEVVVRRP